METKILRNLDKIINEYLGESINSFLPEQNIKVLENNFSRVFTGEGNHEKIKEDPVFISAQFRLLVDILITLAKKSLSGSKYWDFLLVLGDELRKMGNYQIAENIFNYFVSELGSRE